jgi:phosphoribosylamine---glycine ligase
MKVLVIGSGGREHALCWALAASPLVETLRCAPGNGGIAQTAACVALDPLDLEGIERYCKDEAVDFVIVGPEAPLVAGLVDRLEAAGISAFGPSAKAAQLEGSKAFMKEICRTAGVPTAAFARFREIGPARAYIEAQGAPIVVKADGLAAGKGVVVAESVAQAVAAAEAMLGGQFGAAGAELVIEECLVGEEASFFALVDGAHALPLATAQDHKRVGEGDSGPNTGGMGAYSPAPLLTPALCETAMDEIVRPLIAAMADAGAPYVGVLYAGLMVTETGPKLLEINVRFGDPECQVLMPRLASDLLPALMAAREGRLAEVSLRWRDEAALCVVLAAEGYPGAYEKGSEIRGLDEADALDGVTVFHAGTAREDGRIVATGGRVLGVTALGAGIAEAQARAYEGVDAIDWPGGFCRRDIGWRALAR